MKSEGTGRLGAGRGVLLALLLTSGIVTGCVHGRPEGADQAQGKVPAGPGQGSGGTARAGKLDAQAQGADAGFSRDSGGAAISKPPQQAAVAAPAAPNPYLLRLPTPPPPPPPESAEERRQRLEALWRRIGLEFVRVPGGQFEMRTRSGRVAPHLEQVPEFELARHEVTVAQFRAFVEATGYRTAAESDGRCRGGESWRAPGYPQGDDHPVVCVSWHDARAFCEWAGVRLPTEAEWEYAAGYGPRRSTYGWGDEAPSGRKSGNLAGEEARRVLGWTWAAVGALRGHDDGYVYTAPVGSYAPGALGLYDMTGNVMEWTSTAWEMPVMSDGKIPLTGATYALRGGAFESILQNAEVSSATSYFRYNKSNFIGFRVARGTP